jgi:Flp pilus assembly protein TadG
MVRRGRHRGIQKTRKQNGQAQVELASILPLFALILMGCLDLGRAFHVHMAAANAAHVGMMYAQQVTEPITSHPITVADVITKTVNAAQGGIPITLANADSYVKVYVSCFNGGSVPSQWDQRIDCNQSQTQTQTITVTVTDPSFTTITPFLKLLQPHLTTVGGSASGRTLP